MSSHQPDLRQQRAWFPPVATIILATVACTGRSPEAACASASALVPLKQIVLDSTVFLDPELRKIAEEGELSLDRAVVESYDDATGNTVCSGTLSLTLPKQVTTEGGRNLKSGIIYAARASADGGDWVYTSPGIQLSWIVAYLGTIRYNDGRPSTPRDYNLAIGGELARQAEADSYKPLPMLPHDTSGQPKIGSPTDYDHPRPFTPAEQQLADQFLDLNAQCRMGEGPDPDAACQRSDTLLEQMNMEGLCWGMLDQPRAEYTVHRCNPRSIR